MENAVKSRLQSVQLGEAQMCKNIANVPLIAPADGTFQYRTLGQAVAAGDLVITETSANGSISELMVVNPDNKPVLLFDGEELAGAKQNLVLNASILLKEASETKIPVNCTEQGRWSYASKAFSESGNDMAYKSRSKKTRSVHSSLEGCGASMSDQGEVWEGTAYFRAKVCDPSPTFAMNDVFKAREDDLRQCDKIFRSVPNQVGLLAFIGGAHAGVDMLSLMGAHTKIHPKLMPWRASLNPSSKARPQMSSRPMLVNSWTKSRLPQSANSLHRPWCRASIQRQSFGRRPPVLDAIEQPERMASCRTRRRHSYE